MFFFCGASIWKGCCQDLTYWSTHQAPKKVWDQFWTTNLGSVVRCITYNIFQLSFFVIHHLGRPRFNQTGSLVILCRCELQNLKYLDTQMATAMDHQPMGTYPAQRACTGCRKDLQCWWPFGFEWPHAVAAFPKKGGCFFCFWASSYSYKPNMFL